MAQPSPIDSSPHAPSVLRCTGALRSALGTVLGRYGLQLVRVARGDPIPGSYWGEPEAGIIGAKVYASDDTPIHSVLHEASHIICMTPARRAVLHTDAGGDVHEENGVCYLSIVLAGLLPEVGTARMMADMDAWGYSFRLGSARAWFEGDAEDARAWLREADLLGPGDVPSWRLRG